MNERIELRKRLVEITREGRVQDWNERIAIIAEEAGVKMESINWNGSPINIASEVVSFFYAREKVDKLKAVLDSNEKPK